MLKEPKVGVWSLIDSFHVLQAMLDAGINFVVFDFEHGYWRKDQLATAVVMCRERGIYSVARIPNASSEWVQASYDAGTDILQVAGIRSQKDISEVSRLTQFPPHGILGFSPWTPRGYSPEILTNKNPKISIQFEEISILRKFLNDEIELFEHLDSIFIGRYDLSVSMGFPGVIEDSELMTYLEKATKKAFELGLSIGTVGKSGTDLNLLAKMGLNFISVGSDIQRLRDQNPVRGELNGS